MAESERFELPDPFGFGFRNRHATNYALTLHNLAEGTGVEPAGPFGSGFQNQHATNYALSLRVSWHWESNPESLPYQGSALPLSHDGILFFV